MPIKVNTNSNNSVNINVQAEQGNADVTLQNQSQIAAAIGATALYGPQGPKGDKGDTGAQGPRGETGNGIENIEYTSTSGLVDTYTVNFTNGDTTNFEVTNGKDGDTYPNLLLYEEIE